MAAIFAVLLLTGMFQREHISVDRQTISRSRAREEPRRSCSIRSVPDKMVPAMPGLIYPCDGSVPGERMITSRGESAGERPEDRIDADEWRRPRNRPGQRIAPGRAPRE
jgi:hypothetical protein